jgi:hypothetical protein
MRKGTMISGILTVVMALGGCGQRAATHTPATADSAHAASGQRCLFAGAEAYEGLTEHTSTAPMEDLVLEAHDAEATARSCEKFLNAEQIVTLHQVLKNLSQSQDRTSMALAAVEGYRVLVSAQTRSASDIPLDVALLDYAGFRYQAGASAALPLWDDMREVAAFVDQRWLSVAPSISDLALKRRFESDVSALHTAVDAEDVEMAHRAATATLNDVDLLEQYFSNRAHG